MPGSKYEWEDFQVWIYENHTDGSSYLNDLHPNFDVFAKKSVEQLYAECEKARQQGLNTYYAIKAYTAFRLSKEDASLNPVTYSMIRQLYQDDTFMVLVGRILCGDELIYLEGKKTKVFSKLTQNDFFEFYIRRRRAADYWLNYRSDVIENIKRTLFADCLKALSLSAIRCRIGDLGKMLQKKWADIPQFKGSRIDQLLYQMQSLQYLKGWNENAEAFDWFYGYPQLREYMAELLAELFVSIIHWDGKTFLYPQIMDVENDRQLISVLLTAPLTRILTGSALIEITIPKSDSIQPKDTGHYRTAEILTLLRAGILWINTSSRNKYAPLERMPVQIKINESKERLTKLFAEIWKEGAPFQNILCSFIESVSRQQLARLWKDQNPNDEEDDIGAACELEAMLHAYLPAERTEYNERIMQSLVQVIVNMNYGYMGYGSVEQGFTANKNLLSVYRKYPHEVAYAWKRLHTKPGVGRPSELNVCPEDHLDALVFFLKRIQRRIEAAGKENATATEQPDYYAVCAQQCFHSNLFLASERNLPELAKESVAIYIGIMMGLKDRTMPIGGTNASVIMDYFSPCKEALALCKQQIRLPQPQSFDTFFASAITVYNKSLDKYLQENGLEQSADRDLFAIGANDWERQNNISLWAAEKVQKTNKTVELVIPQGVTRRGLHRKWFLAGLDSAALSTFEAENTVGGINSVEARLEGHLLRLQDVVLTCPQLMDSKLMRQLANAPEFLWMLRTGKISCSFYGDIYSLPLYVAQQMEKTYGAAKEGKIGSAFLWSSLSPEFNRDDGARQDAAAYVRGEISYNQLGIDFREELGQLKEAILLLNENLPFFGRTRFYQTTKSQPILKKELLEAYHWLYQWPDLYQSTIRIHESIEHIFKQMPRYIRSDYLSILQFYWGDDSGINKLTNAQQKRAADYREKLMRLDDFSDALKNAEFLLNDSYSRMLARLFTTDFSSPYTQEQQRLLRFSQPSQGGTVYTDSVTPTKSSKCLSWRDVMEYITELDRILEADPKVPLDYIIGSMGDPLSIFEVSNRQSEEYLRTTTVDLTTNSGHRVNLQMSAHGGITHLETKGGKE